MEMSDRLKDEIINTIEWYYVLNEETDRVLYASPALIEECGQELMRQRCQEALSDSPLLRIFRAPIPPEGSLEWELAIGQHNSYLLIRNRRIWYEGHKCRVGVMIHASDVIGVSRDLSGLIVDYQETVQRNKELLREVNWNAYHDSLTSLYNRNRYIIDCTEQFSHQSDYGVMSLDINNLKMINDNYGHEQGDRLIHSVGEALRTLSEEGRTYCYRVGGDEFVLVRLHTSEEDLLELRGRICSELVRAESRDPNLTCCEAAIGYALAGPGMDFETVYRLADDRMYEEKRRMKVEKQREKDM